MKHRPRHTTAEYLADAKGVQGQPIDDRADAFAEAVAGPNKAAWMKERGVKPATGNATWTRLVPGFPRDERRNPLPGQDHAELFARDGIPAIFTFQPYHLTDATLRDLIAVCDRHGLTFDINTWPAWHFPGSVLFVEVTCEDEQNE